MFDIRSHIKAGSVEHAIALLMEDPDARLIAGGTDVLIKLRHGNAQFSKLIDINGLSDLRYIKKDENNDILIGSGTVFTDIIESDLIRTHIPILADAARSVGGPQIRNVATMGGNVCNGVTSADSGPGLFVLNAVLIIAGKNNTRQVPIEKFYQGPGKVDLHQGDVLTAIKIKAKEYENFSGCYYKYAMRNAMDIATIGCGVSLKTQDRKIIDYRIAFGVAGPVPMRCPKTESQVSGSDISEALLEKISNAVVNDVNPRTSWRASKDFRMNIIKALSQRTTRKALGRTSLNQESKNGAGEDL